MEKVPKLTNKETQILLSLLAGNENEETLKDIAKAVREDNQEVKFIYKLRKFFYEYVKKTKN